MNTPTCPIHMCEMVLVPNGKDRSIWRCPIPEEGERLCRRVAAAEQQYRPVICKRCGKNECDPAVVAYSSHTCKSCLGKREKRNRLARVSRRLNSQKAATA